MALRKRRFCILKDKRFIFKDFEGDNWVGIVLQASLVSLNEFPTLNSACFLWSK